MAPQPIVWITQENQGVQSVNQTQKEDSSGYRDRGAIPKQPQSQPQVVSASGSTWPDTHYQGAHGQDRMTNELEQWLTQNNASGETMSKLTQGGFINMALFKTLEPEDVDSMDIRPLAQRKVIKKLCQPSLQGSSQSTVTHVPATTDGPEGIMSGLQSLLGRKTTQHAPGERVDLDPLNYLLPKVKAKHLDITDYVQTTGQEVEEVLSGSGDRQIILKSGPKKIQLENVRPMQWMAAHLKIMMELLYSGRLKQESLYDYIAYTIKISELAESHLWPSVMMFDRRYRELQAQHGFRWGSDTPHLTAVNLKPRQVTPTYKASGRQTRSRTHAEWEVTKSATIPRSGKKKNVCGFYGHMNWTMTLTSSCSYWTVLAMDFTLIDKNIRLEPAEMENYKSSTRLNMH